MKKSHSKHTTFNNSNLTNKHFNSSVKAKNKLSKIKASKFNNKKLEEMYLMHHYAQEQEILNEIGRKSAEF